MQSTPASQWLSGTVSNGLDDRSDIHFGDRWAGRSAFELNRTPPTTPFASAWYSAASVTYNGPGGLRVTAAVIGRRGYRAPLFVTQSLGNETNFPDLGTSVLDTLRRPHVLDTKLRVEKVLTSHRSVEIRVVGEAFNVLNINRLSQDAVASPITRLHRACVTDNSCRPTLRVLVFCTCERVNNSKFTDSDVVRAEHL